MRKPKPPESPAAATLLVEVLTEELPPKALKELGDAFAEALTADLRQDGFLEDGTETRSFATPRRIAAQITRVRARSPDKRIEIPGPSVRIGLDAAGRPTPQLLGFAKKQGVDASTLERTATAKGEVFVYRTLATGSELANHLGLKVQEALKKLPAARIMRWGSGGAEFIRPVHGLVMLHGERVVPGNVLGHDSGRKTAGHRFLGRGTVAIPRAEAYAQVLKDSGRVIASFEVRRELIRGGLKKAAATAAALPDDILEPLLAEVTALVEYPAVYEGRFDEAFLSVPQECLILSMKQHQRYFPLFDRGGRLLNRFLIVSNLEAKDPREIIRGNERVLRARLADAKFFFDQDRKTRLEARVPRLAGVVYHGKLGSQLERVERMQLLAGSIARMLGADALLAERAAWLSKADLLSDMVGEFPELQGVMGRYYALHDGEPRQVADAIEAHYRPRFAGDALPEGGIGIAVALADKLDALAGLFGAGQAPTGDKDPFGLRRAALGVMRILVERDLALPLDALVNAAFAPYTSRLQQASADLESFLYDRLSGYLKERGHSTLEIESVVSLRPARINLVPRQLEAVRAFNRLPEAESLAAANKRVVNILRQAEAKGETFDSAASDMLREPAERALFDALHATSRRATPLLDQGDFTGYLKSFAVLKAPVDAFFDSVMVMAEDPALRQNRLALLAELRAEMNRVADISKLAT